MMSFPKGQTDKADTHQKEILKTTCTTPTTRTPDKSSTIKMMG